MDKLIDRNQTRDSGPASLHPLMVDLILQKLFGNFDTQTLKSVRQVCKRWNYFASELFVSQTRLDLVCVKEKDELDDLFEYVENGTCEPFENISLNLAAGDKEEYAVLKKIINNFIDPLKDSISSLHLHACSDCVRGPSGSPILARVLMLPFRLKSLSLSILPPVIIENLIIFLKYRKKQLPLSYLKDFRIYGRCLYPANFLELLIGQMPNVKTIILKDQPISTTEIILKLLIKFDLKNLKELRFDGMSFIQKNEIQSLGEAKLELDSLKIDLSWFCDVTGPQDYITKCHTLLTSVSSTLQILRVNHKGRDRQPESKLIMPYLPNLKALYLEEWSDFGPLDFMDQLPNLKVLSLESRVKNYQWYTPPIPLNDFVPTKTSGYPQLQELGLLPVTLPEETFERILIMFPNLKKLSMKGTDDLLNVLFRVAPRIQELILVRESQISDFGITGIQIKTQDYLYDGKEQASIPIGYLEYRPSIKNLSHLRRLHIDGFYSTITDVSISNSFGLKSLKNLTSLSIQNCKLTPSSLKEFGNLSLMHLDVTNSLIENSKELWKIVVLAEIAQLKIRCPFLHVISDQDQDEPFLFIINDTDQVK